jgi:hypothetical protein
LNARLDRGDAVASAKDAFALIAAKETAFQGLSYEVLGHSGAKTSDNQMTGGGE